MLLLHLTAAIFGVASFIIGTAGFGYASQFAGDYSVAMSSGISLSGKGVFKSLLPDGGGALVVL